MTTDAHRILSSPCWKKVDEGYPLSFSPVYSLFVKERDQFGGPFMRQHLGLTSDDFHVAYATPEEVTVSSPNTATSPEAVPFPHLVAVPFRVTPGVCDTPERSNGVRQMADGAICALMDMISSFHIMLPYLPVLRSHVSVSIQSNFMKPLVCGAEYLAISKVEKLGRRIVFCGVDFVEPEWTQASAQGAAAPLDTATIRGLLKALQQTTTLASVKHVKSLLS